MHLDKWREPIPCPGSHTGATDSVHRHARRGTSAQRYLEIRGLKRERRKWAGMIISISISEINYGHHNDI